MCITLLHYFTLFLKNIWVTQKLHIPLCNFKATYYDEIN